MDVITSLLFLFAGIGVVNGLIVGLYLLLRKSTPTQSKYLGGLLIVLSIRIGKSIYYYFDHSVDKLILQIGLSACVFIGPLFFKYVTTKKEGSSLVDKMGFSLLVLGILTVGSVLPYRDYPEIWNKYVVQSIYTIWISFVLLGLIYSFKHIKCIYNTSKLKGLLSDQKFIVILAVLFITLTYQSALYFRGITYIWGSIIFTFFFYYMMGRLLLSKTALKGSKQEHKQFPNGDIMMVQVNAIMEKKRLFLSSKLKLDALASEVNLDRNTLSRLLNEVYPHGFSRYVNEFRIEEAKHLIINRPELSFEGIGYEAGFNSKSSFFSAFKKITGSTPAQYQKALSTA